MLGLAGLLIAAIWGWSVWAISDLNATVGERNPDDVESFVRLHTVASGLSSGMFALMMLQSDYILISVVRCFKFFVTQPQLALVPQSLQHTAVDLAHYLIVAVTIFLCYANAGVFLFGQAMHEFANIGVAFSACFNMVLGDFEWDEIAARHRNTA